MAVLAMQVYANDLNPDSFRFLQMNVKLNKACADHLFTYLCLLEATLTDGADCRSAAKCIHTI